jgi:F0F1-type ATP synthase assembly protein I
MKDSSRFRQAIHYSSAGIELSLIVAIFLYAGYRLDKWLGLLPLFTIVFAFTGMGLGFYRLYLMVTSDERREKDSSGKR